MAKIRCRYLTEYCENSASYHCFRKTCNPRLCEMWNCTGVCNGWNEPICDFVRYADAEFEMNARQYEIDLGEQNPTLHIGRSHFDNIVYLQIDGRVLICNRDILTDADCEKEET